MHLGVADRTADRRRVAGDRRRGRPDGRLGRPVQVDDLPGVGREPGRQRGVERFPADQDPLAAYRLRVPPGHLTPQRRRGLHDGAVGEQLGERGRVADLVGAGEDDGRPGHERQQQLQQGDVEADRGHGQQAVGLGERDDPPHRGEEVGEVAARDAHALGATGRTRGVQHVRGRLGQIRRRRCRGRRGSGAGPVEHQPGAGAGQPPGELLGGQQQRRVRLGQHRAQPLDGKLRVQRQERGACAEHCEQRRYEVEVAGQRQRDQPARSGALLGQQTGQPAHAVRQFAVGQRSLAVHDGGRAGGALGLRGDERDDIGARSLERGVVTGGQRGELGGVEQVDGGDRALRLRGGAGAQEPYEAHRVAGDVLSAVRRGVAVDVDAQTVRPHVDVDRQVLHGAVGQVVHGRGASVEGEAVAELLDVQHRAEEPGVSGRETEVAAEFLAAVAVVAQHRQQFPAQARGGPRDRLAGLERGPDRQHVGHHAGRGPGQSAAAAMHGQAEQHLPARGVPSDVGGEGGGDQPDQGAAVPVGIRAQRVRLRRGQLHPVPQEPVRHGPCAARERGRGESAGEVACPGRTVLRTTRRLLVPRRLRQQRLYRGPLRVRGGLGRRLRVLGGDPPGHQGDTVGVEQDVVVEVRPEVPVLGQPHQGEPEQRGLGQVEGPAGLFAQQVQRGGVRIGLGRHVDHRHRPLQVRHGNLPGPLQGRGNPEVQCLGPVHGPSYGAPEPFDVQRPLDVDVLPRRVHRAVLIELLGEPHTLLGSRKRQRSIGGQHALPGCRQRIPVRRSP